MGQDWKSPTSRPTNYHTTLTGYTANTHRVTAQ